MAAQRGGGLSQSVGREGVGPRGMAKTSAGLLMFRRPGGEPEVLLVHPGGPFWARQRRGGVVDSKGRGRPRGGFAGRRPPRIRRAEGPFIPLTPLRQPSAKMIHAWTFEGDADPARLRSNVFSLEWPPKSGRRQEFPEADT
jgi:predicted NUDIX family NTP pyrophosphohydrolase